MDLGFDTAFYEIAALVLLAAGLGFLGLVLRQPLVVAFIVAGVLAGPDALGIVASPAFIETLSQISIAVLLFLVGLKLDVGLIRSLGRVAVTTGLGQIGLTAALGFLICLGLGIGWREALYIAVALTFSSTIIIVKLLSDKQEIDSLHGRIALGILIVQDIFVVLAMMALSAVGVGSAAEDGGLGQALRLAAGGLGMLTLVFLFIRFVATPLLGLIARSPELLVIAAVGWAAGFAALGDWVGFGKELGGLLAGVALASTRYREAILSRLASLRDFLLLFFFLHLGAGIDLGGLGGQVWPALVLSVFVLIAKPLIVLVLMGWIGYRRRTGFLAGLTLAQISEFSLIFMAMGVALGHVSEAALTLVTLVGLVTIALSVYMITYSHHLLARAEPRLALFDRPGPGRERAPDAAGAAEGAYDVILFGLGRFGRGIGTGLSARGLRVLGVDFDPEALAAWSRLGLDGRFGDATDPEAPLHLPLSGVRAVVAAVSRAGGPLTEAHPQLALLHGLRAARFRGRVVLSADSPAEAARLRALGADDVLVPFEDAAAEAVDRIVASLRAT
jgi:Kef-type K+ transport system membrane component KefB